MIPILFESDTTNFNNNGVGPLVETVTYEVYEEANGEFELTLQYPVTGRYFTDIKDDMIIQASPNEYDEPHNFRIYEMVKDTQGGTVYIYAHTVTNDLAGNLVMDLTIENETPQQAFDKLKANLVEPTSFNFVSDISTQSNARWTLRNPLSCIVGGEDSLVKYWGGEVKRTNDTIYLYSRRGRDNVTVIRPEKGLEGLTMTVSTKGLVTRILPYFTYYPEGSEDEVRIVGDIVDSPLKDNYPIQRIVPVDFSDDQSITDVSDLNNAASRYFTYINPGVDKPSVKLDIDLQQMSDSSEYSKFKHLEQIRLFDTVTVYVKKFDIDVLVKINSVKYNGLQNRVTKITAGSNSTSLIESTRKTYQDTTDALRKYISTVENGVKNYVDFAAGGKAKVFRGYTEPSGDLANENDIWFRPVGDGEVIMYTYNGLAWVPEEYSAASLGGTINFSNVNAINFNADWITSGRLDLAYGLEIGNGSNKILGVNSTTGEVEMNISKLTVNAKPVATLEDLEEIELTPGPSGKTAYQIAVENGFVGTQQQWLNSLVGSDGTPGADGKDGKDGKDGLDGVSSYTWVRYSTSANGNPMVTTPTALTKYIGVAVTSVNAAPTSHTLYSWSKFMGDDAVQLYTWIRYADTPTSGMSPSPTGKAYIGIATNKTSPTPSLVYSDYDWSKYTGRDGVDGTDGKDGQPGANGTDGITTYTWVRYADTAAGVGISTSPTGKKYIGWAFNKQTAAGTNNPSDYTWSKYVGEDGASGTDGLPGKDGVGLSGTVLEYASSTSGTTKPTSGWSSTIPTVPAGNYLWTRTTWTYTDLSTEMGYSVSRIGKDGNNGTNGVAGKDGVGVTDTVITYASSTSGTTAPTSGWSGTIPTVAAGSYLWTRTVWTYTDNTTETGYSVGKMGNTGAQGPKGNDGTNGIAGKDGVGLSGTALAYASSTSGTVTPTSGWSSTVPTVPAGNYLWTRTVWTYTDNTSETGYSVSRIGKDGNNGTNGVAGKDGVGITNTTITYVGSTSGTTKPTSGWSSTIPTVAAGSYLWTRTVWTYSDNTTETGYSVAKMGNTGATGGKGDKGDPGTNGISIVSVDVEYARNQSTTTAPTSGWSTTTPSWAGGYYIWSRTKTTYSSGSPTYSSPACITGQAGQTGATGGTGATGATGKGISSITEEYVISTSKTTAPTTGWGTTVPTWVYGSYIWTRSKIVWNNPSSTTYTTAVPSTEWEAVNELEIGGRNLIIRHNERVNTNVNVDGVVTGAIGSSTILDFIDVVPGEVLTFSKKVTGDVGAAGDWWRYSWHGEDGSFIGRAPVSSDEFQFVIPENAYKLRVSYPTNADVKVERGNKATDWTPAPEDVQVQIDSKASQDAVDGLQSSLDDLNNIVGNLGIESIQQELAAYQQLLSQVEADSDNAKAQLEYILSDTNGALKLIHTTLDQLNERWTTLDGFVEINGSQTAMTISKGNTSMVIDSDSLTFYSGGDPVATITNQYMKINRTIVVDGMHVGRHEWGPLNSDRDHFVLSYVGEAPS